MTILDVLSQLEYWKKYPSPGDAARITARLLGWKPRPSGPSHISVGTPTSHSDVWGRKPPSPPATDELDPTGFGTMIARFPNGVVPENW